MRNRFKAVVVIFALILSYTSQIYAEQPNATNVLEIFVSQVNGDDKQLGTKEAPLRTIGKATELAQSHKNESVNIIVEHGDYYENVSFDENDKRSAEFPLKIQNEKNNYVRLIGAQKISAESATSVSDKATLDRIIGEVQDKILQIDLKAQGITEYGEIVPINFGQLSPAPPELFIDGSVLSLARWPNSDYTRIESVVSKNEDSFSFTAMNINDRILRWTNAKDVWAYGFWYWDWANAGVKVTKIVPQTGAITVSSREDVRGGQRFYIYNLLEELDAPGEFYLDRETGMLYFYSSDKTDALDDILLSLSTAPLLEFKNTGNITVEGIEIGFTRGNGIYSDNSDGITIENCKIWYTGQLGIQAEETVNLTVSGCTITETGAGGIKNTGGDYVSLTPSNNLFCNNHIYKFSRIIKSYTPALRVEGVGAKIANNLIHDEEHIAILYNGNDNVIEYNEIYNVCTSTDDSGAIYTGQRWNDRGNVVRYNYLHDIVGHEGSYGVSGVYLDDVHSSTSIYGNIFYNVSRAVLVGGGRDNRVENNMILEASPSSTASIVIDARGLESWFQPNLDPDTGIVYEHLSKVPYQSEIWKNKYPELYTIMENSPKEPRGNVVKNNIIYNHKDMAIPSIVKKYGEVKDNYITDYEDIGFVNYEEKDFRLRENAVVFEALPEFKQIPIDKIGLLSGSLEDVFVSDELISACSDCKENIVLAVNANQALVNGQRCFIFGADVRVIRQDGSTYLPIRFLAEQLGYNVGYDAESQSIDLSLEEEKIRLFLHQKLVVTKGETQSVLSVPIIINDRVFVELGCLKAILPVNIFSNATGIIVIGNGELQTDKKSLSLIKSYLLDENHQEG